MTDTSKSVWLTDAVVRNMPLPKRGKTVRYDAPHPKQGWTSGFGVRVTAAGARSFILRYRSKRTRLEHLVTIGGWPSWSTTAARAEAQRLKLAIARGADPQVEKQLDADAPTVSQLADRFLSEHVAVKVRPATAAAYKSVIACHVKPAWGKRLVAAITTDDVQQLHRSVTQTAPFSANRVVAVVSKMMALAVRWRPRGDNPARGIERNPEPLRRRYLSNSELVALTRALAEHEDQSVADVFRMLLLCGSRKHEVLSARWGAFDFERNVWRKESHETKQRRQTETPLSDAALALLRSMREAAPADAVYLFSGQGAPGHVSKVRKAWIVICKRAGITGLRVHDLRHSHASFLVSAGYSLPVIGSLLGHSRPETTARYAHLSIDARHEAVNRIGAQLSGLIAKRPKRGSKPKVVKR